MQLFKLCSLLFVLVAYGCAGQGPKSVKSVSKQDTSSQSAISDSLGQKTLVIQDINFSEDAEPPVAVKLECNLINELFDNIKKGVAIFAKDCFGHPSPSNRQKLNATY
jgi:hypothetical protein